LVVTDIGTAVVTVVVAAGAGTVVTGITVVVTGTGAGVAEGAVVCGTSVRAGSAGPPLMIHARPTETMMIPRINKIVELFIRVIISGFG
jgi:hypothetical protein